ncbi:IS1096 element passenger TnpR family protein [Cupriavidus sp. P-10]|uniref:IS1096 element passenger TnpR family protein n=1 Tax=unclassified Cupriavidus TaxID=2640874 RepID=UPI000E2EA7AD
MSCHHCTVCLYRCDLKVRDRTKAGERPDHHREANKAPTSRACRSWGGDLHPSTSNCSAWTEPAGLATRPPPEHLTLAQLHDVFQVITSWTDEHLHQFSIRGRRYGEAREGAPQFSAKANRADAMHGGDVIRVERRVLTQHIELLPPCVARAGVVRRKKRPAGARGY